MLSALLVTQTRATINKGHGHNVSVGWKTLIRETITSVLPPPATKAIQQFDRVLEARVGPEASITVGSAVFLAWIVWVLILIKVRHVLFGGGRAVIDEKDNRDITTRDNVEQCKATVVLCGPTSAGKTRMFYQLCYGSKYADIPTLMSIKVNVAVGLANGNCDPNRDKQEFMRYIDWPGTASLDDPNFVALVTKGPSKSLRIVLVVDSTQPVGAAGEILFNLLDLINIRKDREPLTIFIACHKKDIPKSKNHKRIKIQIRSELEKLLAVRAKTDEVDGHARKSLWWHPGKPLELDDLSLCKLHFASTTCSGRGLSEVIDYCSAGIVP